MKHCVQIYFGLDKDTAELLIKVCRATGEIRSNFIRRAVKKALAQLSYFSDEDKKALGVQKINEGNE